MKSYGSYATSLILKRGELLNVGRLVKIETKMVGILPGSESIEKRTAK